MKWASAFVGVDQSQIDTERYSQRDQSMSLDSMDTGEFDDTSISDIIVKTNTVGSGTVDSL